MAAEHGDCNDAVKRIVSQIDMTEISNFIDNVPYISDRQKEFYKQYMPGLWNRRAAPER